MSPTTKMNTESIRVQIELLKNKLDSIEETLNVQEEALDLLYKKSKCLFEDAIKETQTCSQENIMRKAFTNGRIPKILFKN
jgi:predicted nucleic-acid-binding protein